MKYSRIILSITFLLLLSQITTSSKVTLDQTITERIDPVFSFTLLSPNSNSARNEWAILIADDLRKIGIDVNHSSVDWDMLGPRTYTHPRDGSGAHNGAGIIPVYENGGYDAYFVGLSGD
ncbi:MAG: hypothetical protein ACXAD7_16420, partial [Candidatus Kariarchaeaceae archaeon]